MQSSPLLSAYNNKIAAGILKPDEAQKHILSALLKIEKKLIQKTSKKKWLVFFNSASQENKTAEKTGFYLYGSVGSGKTLLMDLFYDNLPIKNKKRLHYHVFMRDIHNILHKVRQSSKKNPNLLAKTAKIYCKNTRIICLDEFFIRDIADATIIYRLFLAIFDMGIIIVLTSNIAPDDIYKKGLNRHYVLPFMKFITDKMDVLAVKTKHDWRQQQQICRGVYNLATDKNSECNFFAIWKKFLNGQKEQSQTVTVVERDIIFSHTTDRVLRTSFNRLCFSEYAAVDYIAICERFDVIMIEGLHSIDREAEDVIVRWVSMIDIFYENNTIIVILAEDLLDNICPLIIKNTVWKRMLSRLHEMQTIGYIQRAAICSNTRRQFLEYLTSYNSSQFA